MSTLAELREDWDEHASFLRWAEEIAEGLPGIVEGFIADHGVRSRIEGELLAIDLYRMSVEGDAMSIEQWYYDYSAEAYERARGLIRAALDGKLDMSDIDLTDELVERLHS